MTADGLDQTRLTEDSVSDTDPSCSLSENRIVYTSTKDGNGEVYVIDLDGSTKQRITNNDASRR